MTLRVDAKDLTGTEDRYHRQSLIAWWDQDLVRDAKILVIGAGALGNEVLKSLALLGIGHVLVYDMDRIEESNLNRSVLFRTGDEGRPKAAVAVERMRELNPDVAAHAREENVAHRAGLGVFLWADVVIGAVDNREARVFVNSACARARRTWVDGAIEGFAGTVRAFRPHDGPCYECTMNATDRRLLAERRSCAMLARTAVVHGHVPATVVVASLIGALQVQEAIKILHDQPALIGEGIHFDGLWNQVSRVAYPRRDDCFGHETLEEIETLDVGAAGITLGALLTRAETELGEGAVLELSRDVVTALTCPACEIREPIGAALGEIDERRAACPDCGAHRLVETASSVDRSGRVDLDTTPADLGVPPFDVIVARRGLEDSRTWLLDGDAADVLGEENP